MSDRIKIKDKSTREVLMETDENGELQETEILKVRYRKIVEQNTNKETELIESETIETNG